jgi:hypothetical protein
MKRLLSIVATTALLTTMSMADPCDGPDCGPTTGTGTIDITAGINPYAIVALKDVSGETLNRTDFIDAKIEIGCADEADFDNTVASASKPVFVKTNSCDVTMEVEPENLKGGCFTQPCPAENTIIPTRYWIDTKSLSQPVTIATKPNAGSTSIGDFKIETDIANASGTVDGIVPSGAYCATLNVKITAK